MCVCVSVCVCFCVFLCLCVCAAFTCRCVCLYATHMLNECWQTIIILLLFVCLALAWPSLSLALCLCVSLSLCLSAGLYVCLSFCLPVRLSVSSHDFATRLRNSVSVVVRPSACLVQSSHLSHSTLPVSFSLSACLFVCLTAFVIRIRCCICAVDYFLLIFLSLFEQIFTCNVELPLSRSLFPLSSKWALRCFSIWN